MAKPLGSSCIKSVYLVKVKQELFLSSHHDFFTADSPSYFFFSSCAFFSPLHLFLISLAWPHSVWVLIGSCRRSISVATWLGDWIFAQVISSLLSHPHSHFRCHTLSLLFYPPIFLSPLHNLFFSQAFSPSVSYSAARLIDQCILIHAPAWFLVAALGKKEWEWKEWEGRWGKKDYHWAC